MDRSDAEDLVAVQAGMLQVQREQLRLAARRDRRETVTWIVAGILGVLWTACVVTRTAQMWWRDHAATDCQPAVTAADPE